MTPEAKTIVIPNGIDSTFFSPDRGIGRGVRLEWAVADSEKLIGLVARLDPMKDHAVFIHAARILAKSRPKTRFVCVGDGPPVLLQRLRELCEAQGLADRVIWAGARGDMPAMYNAMDLATSASRYGEGFSNVVAEAMACGVPCVVTNVGDSAFIVGDTGVVVPPGDAAALAAAWEEFLTLTDAERLKLGESARARIRTEFGVDKLVQRTTDAIVSIL